MVSHKPPFLTGPIAKSELDGTPLKFSTEPLESTSKPRKSGSGLASPCRNKLVSKESSIRRQSVSEPVQLITRSTCRAALFRSCDRGKRPLARSSTSEYCVIRPAWIVRRPSRNQTRNDVVNFEGDAMAMHFPVRTRMTQEAGAFLVRKRFPNILRHGTKRIDHRSPVDALGRCRTNLIADQVH